MPSVVFPEIRVSLDIGCRFHSVAVGLADGDVLDILVQKRKDKRAAERFFKKLMKRQSRPAREIVIDKLPSYGSARIAIMPTSMHCCDRYANNRAEVSHEHM